MEAYGTSSNSVPSIYFLALVQVGVHLAFVLGLGKLLYFDLKHLLLASNGNVGGPTTSSATVTVKRWYSLVVPGILVGLFYGTKCEWKHMERNQTRPLVFLVLLWSR